MRPPLMGGTGRDFRLEQEVPGSFCSQELPPVLPACRKIEAVAQHRCAGRGRASTHPASPAGWKRGRDGWIRLLGADTVSGPAGWKRGKDTISGGGDLLLPCRSQPPPGSALACPGTP